MKAVMQVTKYAPETFNTRKGQSVTQDVLTMLEVKEDGGMGSQFYAFAPSEADKKLITEKPVSKRILVEWDTIRQLFAGTAKLGDAKIIKLA